jgi:hypothetical protein
MLGEHTDQVLSERLGLTAVLFVIRYFPRLQRATTRADA